MEQTQLGLCVAFVNEWAGRLTDESTASSCGKRGFAVDFLVAGSWESLPEPWRDYFSSQSSLEEVLKDLNRLEVPPNCEPSLERFIRNAKKCCFSLPQAPKEIVRSLSFAEARGIKKKKREEIQVFAALVADFCCKVQKTIWKQFCVGSRVF
jgi:hypothetical protein